MKKYYYFLILLLGASFSPITSDPIVCFFFKAEQNIDIIADNLKKPGNLAHHSIHKIVQHVPIAGIYATYSGYIATSNETGEVRFPRKHRENNITIIVTPAIEPIALFDNTLLHWKLLPHVPAEMYKLQETYNSTNKEYEWTSQKIDLPIDNTIPLAAIVILAKPKNVFIPSETTKTLKSANLVLPPIYVKKGINIMTEGINTLIFRHLFRPVEEKAKQEPVTQLSTLLLN